MKQVVIALLALNCIPLLLSAMMGCGEPIYTSESIEAAPASITLAPAHDHSFYEWPLTRDGYVVSRPPQMAFLTSFDQKLTYPDPVSAELVPWSNEGLDEMMAAMLDHAYLPPQRELKTVLTLDSSQLAGPAAFDVSTDGSRLVVVDAQGLALYNTKDGSLIGRRKLPSEIADMPSPATAVRFCGQSKELMVACNETIVRLSRKDGSVTGQVDGVGELIAQWIVTANDESMLIRGISGKLFGGDSRLKYFSSYELGKDATFDDVSLSPDGSRIGVVVDHKPRIYVQQAYKIVEKIDQLQVTLNPGVSIGMGISSDAWADGDGLCFTYMDAEGSRKWAAYQMFWKPLQISMTAQDEKGNSFLIVGKRFIRGKEQVILFDFGAMGRAHSLPQILEEVPTRFAHSHSGDVIAMLDSQGLRLCHRPKWRPYNPIFLNDYVHRWLDEMKFRELEKMLSIIASQERMGFGKTSEELRTMVIQAIAYRWRYLAENEPDSDVGSALEQWRQEGNQIALVADGLRHYRQAWNHRGAGLAGSVTKEGWEGYERHLKLASDRLDEALAIGSPPLVAIETRIQAGLEQVGELEQADPLCRLACELYPGEVSPYQTLAFKLMPQWFGEPGDSLSFASSAGRMYQEPHGDFLYMRLVSTMTRYLDMRDPVGWKSYDPMRVRRGVRESIRRRANISDDLWNLLMQLVGRTNDVSGTELVLAHLMETTAVPPSRVTDGEEQRTFISMITRMQETIWKE